MKMASSVLPKVKNTVTETVRITMPSSRHRAKVFLQRFNSPAPKFCPTKVVQAWEKELRIS